MLSMQHFTRPGCSGPLFTRSSAKAFSTSIRVSLENKDKPETQKPNRSLGIRDASSRERSAPRASHQARPTRKCSARKAPPVPHERSAPPVPVYAPASHVRVLPRTRTLGTQSSPPVPVHGQSTRCGGRVLFAKRLFRSRHRFLVNAPPRERKTKQEPNPPGVFCKKSLPCDFGIRMWHPRLARWPTEFEQTTRADARRELTEHNIILIKRRTIRNLTLTERATKSELSILRVRLVLAHRGRLKQCTRSSCRQCWNT